MITGKIMGERLVLHVLARENKFPGPPRLLGAPLLCRGIRPSALYLHNNR